MIDPANDDISDSKILTSPNWNLLLKYLKDSPWPNWQLERIGTLSVIRLNYALHGVSE